MHLLYITFFGGGVFLISSHTDAEGQFFFLSDEGSQRWGGPAPMVADYYWPQVVA